MSDQSKLIFIKILHTLIWVFFNIVIFYMLYAVINNKLDTWLWIGYGFFAIEGLVLAIYNMHCPLTLVAHKYTNDHKIGFDIYLPSWLAKYNKLIYSIILIIVGIITVYQLLQPK